MERLMTALLELSLPMAAVIAVLLAAGPLLGRRFTAKWRYWAWLFIAVRLLLPVGIPLPQPVIILPQPQGEITYPVRAGETTAPTPAGDPILVLPGDTADEPGRETGTLTPAGEPIGAVPEQPVSDPYRQIEPGMTAPGTEQSAPVTPPAAAAQTPPAPRTVTVMELMGLCWAAGAILFLGWQWGSYLLLRVTLRRSCRPVTGEKIQALLQKETAAAGLERVMPVYTAAVGSPMIVGAVRPVLLLP